MLRKLNLPLRETSTQAINYIIDNSGNLPPCSFPELHPYKIDVELKNFEKYIIGTFPPISYLLDDINVAAAGLNTLMQPANGNTITRAQIPFFHGNKSLMWDFLLTRNEIKTRDQLLLQTNGRQNARQYLIDFLNLNNINYADIIDQTQRKLEDGNYTSKDKNLYNIIPNNNLICHLLSNPSAKYLLFNTANIFTNAGFKSNTLDSFNLFIEACQRLNLTIEIQINQGASALFSWINITSLTPGQRCTKVAFEMKIRNPLDNEKLKELDCDFKPGEEKSFIVITPFSPAAAKRGKTKNNKCVQKWLLLNPGMLPADLLTLVYQNFRNGQLQSLFNLNV